MCFVLLTFDLVEAFDQAQGAFGWARVKILFFARGADPRFFKRFTRLKIYSPYGKFDIKERENYCHI